LSSPVVGPDLEAGTGCWADVYDADHEEMKAGEADPEQRSPR
jgi:hypothetical protein